VTTQFKNWPQAFKVFDKTGEFPEGAAYEAGGWERCAFWSQAKKLPKKIKVVLFGMEEPNEFDEPVDKKLASLGGEFAVAVDFGTGNLAKRLYVKIAERIARIEARIKVGLAA